MTDYEEDKIGCAFSVFLLILVLTWAFMAQRANASDVVLVTTTGCPPCETMKRRLHELGIPFTTASIADMQETGAPVMYVFKTVDGKPVVIAKLRGLQDAEAIKLAVSGATGPPK